LSTSLSRSVPLIGVEARRRWLGPLGLFLGALLLYCVNLDDGLTVHDELHHILAARSLLETGEPRIADGLYSRALLHTWLVAQSLRLFGDTLFAARLPSVVPMALLVMVLFVWLRASAGTAAAWTAAVLFAVSPYAVDYAQFVRFYALQMLAFLLAALALQKALQGSGGAPRRLALALAGLALLALAVEFQETTLIGVGGLAVWAVLALGLPWLADPAVPQRRKRAVLALLAGVGLAGLLGLWATGQLETLWYRYRTTPLFNQPAADQFWYYHAWFLLYYPALWPATGLLALLALATAPRPALLALAVFATAFLVSSFAAAKAQRYLAYALPFLFALWGIGLAALGPAVRSGLTKLARGLGPALGIAGRAGQRLGTGLVALAFLVLVLANPAWLRTVSLLTDVTIPPEEPHVRWRLAVPVLAPLLAEAEVVLTTSELETLYHLGRYDLLISGSRRSELPFHERHELGIDPRTGRPVLAEAATLARVMDCAASGIILSVAHQWSRTFQADAAVKGLVEARAEPVPLPPRSRVLAWTWTQPPGWTRPADCAELARLWRRDG
jgi:4-amino-4-deoxy-L-arabinose transferase-like glycosyltransferase